MSSTINVVCCYLSNCIRHAAILYQPTAVIRHELVILSTLSVVTVALVVTYLAVTRRRPKKRH